MFVKGISVFDFSVDIENGVFYIRPRKITVQVVINNNLFSLPARRGACGDDLMGMDQKRVIQ